MKDGAAFHEIPDPLALPLGVWFWVAAAVAAAFLIGAGIFLWARRPRPNAAVPPDLPPWVRAGAGLAALQAALRAGIPTREFYIRLSDVVRHYIEERFGIQAPEMTTEEFMASAAASALLAEPHRVFLRAFLESCDLVKFARLEPGLQDQTSALEAARRFVEGTTPSGGGAP